MDAWKIQGYWTAAFQNVTGNESVRRVFLASPEEPGELSQAIARSLLAHITRLAMQDGATQLGRGEREQIIDVLMADWETRVAGLGGFLASFLGAVVSEIATPLAANSRADWAARSAPNTGDILLYQVRGSAIREYIRKIVTDTEGEVVLLGHSLGGVACVDLVVSQHIPRVTHLITVGSQASYLYEIGALQSLPPSQHLLPEHFPLWLNVYDPFDFLSFPGEKLFGNRIRDARVESKQPFPASHGAYWTNNLTWHYIKKFLEEAHD